MTCIDKIIGISETDCDCYVTDLNSELTENWYKESESGLYLDQLEGIVSLRQVRDSATCNEKIGDIYAKALRNAIKYVYDDFIRGIHEKYTPERKQFKGRVGAKVWKKNLTLNRDYAGAKLFLAKIPDGFVKITDILTLFDGTGEIELLVIKKFENYDNWEVVAGPITLQTQINKAKENILAEPIYLPAYDDEDQRINYYFLYESGELNPKDNLNTCGCGKKEADWRSYGHMVGVQGDNLDKLSSFSESTYMSGLAFGLQAGCDINNLICQMYPNEPAFSAVLAHAVRFRAGMIVQKEVADSDEITRETMLDVPVIGRAYNIFQSEYNIRLQWLIEHADLSSNGCYDCTEKRMKKQGIRG